MKDAAGVLLGQAKNRSATADLNVIGMGTKAQNL